MLGNAQTNSLDGLIQQSRWHLENKMKQNNALHSGACALVGGALLALVSLPFSTAEAAVITNCPDPADGSRTFTITTAAGGSCLAYGTGNLQGDVGLQSDFFTQSAAGAGYVILDKDPGNALPGLEDLFQVTGLGATSGTFTVDAALWAQYSSIAIGFQVGQNPGITPHWAVFGLAPDTLTGEWSTTPQQAGGLSHANAYGIPGTTTVSEPSPLALLALALFGGVLLVRHRQSAAA